MSFEKFEKMSIADLKKEELQLRKDIFENRMRAHSGEFTDVSFFGKARKDIARIKTAISQKELEV